MTVIPAKAGIQRWVPAFAGMTVGSELPPPGMSVRPETLRVI